VNLKKIAPNSNRIGTVCLSSEALRFEEQIEIILNAAESWDVTGIYLVPEHPSLHYLVDDPMWLANLLILCSGFALQGKEVIVGYCSHQMLCLSAAMVSGIASGSWLNVRSFLLDKFYEPDPDAVSRRSTWYYCPGALSEFKVPFLDMAHRSSVLHLLHPGEGFNTDYSEMLFSGAQPTTTNFSEREAHRHYLNTLHTEASQSQKNSYRDTYELQIASLNEAETLIDQLHQAGIRGQDRDFVDYINVNRSALAALDQTRGFVLDRSWSV